MARVVKQPRRIRKGEPGHGKKKFVVVVRNPKTGNDKTIRFGDANLEIKRDSAKRRKSFRARHNCKNPGPNTSARYWSCKTWQKGKTVGQVMGKKKKKK
tara:strand:- start:455 stop:751 length:297 start_codon:yes stop_codon:yes gene_type:complete